MHQHSLMSTAWRLNCVFILHYLLLDSVRTLQQPGAGSRAMTEAAYHKAHRHWDHSNECRHRCICTHICTHLVARPNDDLSDLHMRWPRGHVMHLQNGHVIYPRVTKHMDRTRLHQVYPPLHVQPTHTPALCTQSVKYRVGNIGGDQRLHAFIHAIGSFFITSKPNLHLYTASAFLCGKTVKVTFVRSGLKTRGRVRARVMARSECQVKDERQD